MILLSSSKGKLNALEGFDLAVIERRPIVNESEELRKPNQ